VLLLLLLLLLLLPPMAVACHAVPHPGHPGLLLPRRPARARAQ
jgi:hypothetical protein